MTPRIALVTLCLNELEWLPRLWEQHKDWPGLVRWVFVEAADPVYAATNPDMVSAEGLSVDHTSAWLDKTRENDLLVEVVRPGTSEGWEPAQAKCHARTAGLRALDDARPDFVVVLDADEFYTREHQQRINEIMADPCREHYTSFAFGLRSIWRPPSIAHEPLMRLEAKGGVWSVPICRGWRWRAGMEYKSNHNSPEAGGVSLASMMLRLWNDPTVPECVHMGFTASLRARRAKHAYYRARGEGSESDPKLRTNRGRYVQCRSAWETWKPGKAPTFGLPPGCVIVPYNGPVPEVFR